jgi:hypothetical protein
MHNDGGLDRWIYVVHTRCISIHHSTSIYLHFRLSNCDQEGYIRSQKEEFMVSISYGIIVHLLSIYVHLWWLIIAMLMGEPRSCWTRRRFGAPTAPGWTLGLSHWKISASMMFKWYPLVNKHGYWKWWFIVDLPINSMVIFHSYM